MKIIKFKQKKFYSYKRKVLIRDLVLNMLVGIHNFEKKKKQRVKFNLVINVDQNLIPSDKDLKSIVNYEQVIKTITKITSRKHYPLLETLAEKIFSKLLVEIRLIRHINREKEKENNKYYIHEVSFHIFLPLSHYLCFSVYLVYLSFSLINISCAKICLSSVKFAVLSG